MLCNAKVFANFLISLPSMLYGRDESLCDRPALPRSLGHQLGASHRQPTLQPELQSSCCVIV